MTRALWKHYSSWFSVIARFRVGQNLYIGGFQSDTAGTSDWNAAVTEWYNEVQYMNTTYVQSYTWVTLIFNFLFQGNSYVMRSVWFCIFFRHRSSSPNVIGHYTQAVWADTYLVGCAVAYFQSTGVRNLSEIEFFVLSLCWDFVYLFRFLDQNFPIIQCTFAIRPTVQLAIIAAMLFISKELPDPPAPQVLWTATACVHI
jgi:hypothetical protein